MKPFTCILIQNTTSERSKLFSPFNCVYNIFSVFISRIKRRDLFPNALASCFRTSLEYSNYFLFKYFIDYVTVSYIVYDFHKIKTNIKRSVDFFLLIWLVYNKTILLHLRQYQHHSTLGQHTS